MKNEVLKVVHIDTEKYWGGGQNQVFLLHKYLKINGVSSVVFAHKNSPLLKKLKLESLPVLPLSLIKLILFVLLHKPDIIHCHTGKAYYYGILIKLLFPGLKLIFTRRIMKIPKFIKLKLRLADYVICVSTAVMKSFLENGAQPDKISVIYDGVEPAQKTVDTPLWSSDFFVVGTVGTLNSNKDQKTLIRGFSVFQQNHRKAILVIIGDGPDKISLRRLVGGLGLKNNVVFTGFIEDAAAYIKYMSVFVITSAFAESLCTSIIDAFFQKVPVIATNVGGVPELVKNGETGILIETKDPAVLSYTIELLFKDKKLCEKLAENAYNHAQNFTVKKMVAKHLDLYIKKRK